MPRDDEYEDDEDEDIDAEDDEDDLEADGDEDMEDMDDMDDEDDDGPEVDHKKEIGRIEGCCRTLKASMPGCGDHTRGYIGRDLQRIADRMERHGERAEVEVAKQATAAALKKARLAAQKRKRR